MLPDHANQTFDQCIKCTVCTAYRPGNKANLFSLPWPQAGGPGWRAAAHQEPGAFRQRPGYCTNRKRCEVACPSGSAHRRHHSPPSTSTAASKLGIRECPCSPTPI